MMLNVRVIMLRTLVLQCYERWCYNATNVSEVWGVRRLPIGFPPGPGNRFRFVFVSCVRAGEAKLRVREKSASLPLGLPVATFRAPAPPPPPPVRVSGVKLSPLSRSGPISHRKDAFCAPRARLFAR